MKKIALPLTACALASALLAGCETPQQSTALGVGIGAATGAGIGALIGDSRGALIGGAIGAAAGGLTGYNWSTVKRRLTNATRGTEAEVTEQRDGSLKLNVPSSVSFDTNSYHIKPSFAPVLDQLAQTLAQYPELAVHVIGHTDSTGRRPAYNKWLSQQRAQAVVNYLMSRGIAASRLSSEGRGQEQPIADNRTEEGRAKNRRVEIFLRALQQY